MTARTSNGRTIVVGYDGSEAARAAVTVAARRAGEDGRLVIVHSSHEVLHLADRPVTVVPPRDGRDD